MFNKFQHFNSNLTPFVFFGEKIIISLSPRIFICEMEILSIGKDKKKEERCVYLKYVS